MEVINEAKVGYKKTKLGWIPEDWEVLMLGDVVDFLDGKRKPIKESDRKLIFGDYPYYGASGIIDYVNSYIFDDHLILLGEDGANILARSTRLSFKVEGKIWVNNHAHVLKPKAGCHIDYLNDYLESLNYEKYNTSKAQPKLNKSECLKIRIALPSENEQIKIGEILCTWDKAIEKQQGLIGQLQERKKGLMQQLLTGKLRLKDADGVLFAEEWKEVKLGDITTRKITKNVELNDNVITISAQRGFIRQEEYFNKRVASKTLSGYYLIEKGDFAYNKSYSKGYPMGAFKRLDNLDKAVVTTLYICFSLRDNINSDFLLNYFEGGLIVNNLMKIAQEGGRAHGLLNIGLSDFFGLKLTIPSTLKEQQAIAKVLTTADKVIVLAKEKLLALQEQKKGLMQQLLTGAIRVNVKQ